MTTLAAVSFGTSGHRGVIGDAFTVSHVYAIGKAVGRLFSEQGTSSPRIVIGYDPRQGNSPHLEEDSFTLAICRALLDCGAEVLCCETPCPTPVISWLIEEQRLDGGLILTASHNPPNYNGIKFNPSNGAPAPGSITSAIERYANDILQDPTLLASDLSRLDVLDRVSFINPISDFCKALVSNVSACFGEGSLDFSDIPLAVDIKHGTGQPVWQELGALLGLNQLELLHGEPRSDFGGIEPNPTKFSTLNGLRDVQKRLQAPIACAHDPDCDRHVVLDDRGDVVSPEMISVILADYFSRHNRPIKGLVSTVASSAILKSCASSLDIEYQETAVGFKHFASFLELCRKEDGIGFGVESSGGFTTSFHTLEKCGFLPVIMLLFLIKITGYSLSNLVKNATSSFGYFHFKENEFHYLADKKSVLSTFFNSPDTALIHTLFGDEISINDLDGLKICYPNGDWVLMRLSGTEPLARLYAESESSNRSESLIEKGQLLLSKLAE